VTMASAYPCLVPQRKTGSERFHCNGIDAGFDLASFWQWSVSDLVSNATRGILAEYIVAQALGVAGRIRNEWDSFDLTTTAGVKVEVKSAAYVQTWYQRKLSDVIFRYGPKRGFDAATNTVEREPRWQADVYVFALLKHRYKSTIDPLNIGQWEFYCLRTSTLQSRTRSKVLITLKSLQKLDVKPVGFDGLKKAIEDAARPNASLSAPTGP